MKMWIIYYFVYSLILKSLWTMVFIYKGHCNAVEQFSIFWVWLKKNYWPGQGGLVVEH